jgi:VIT1/CCC1 family predicted Fe2+/Mn2+ transporter
MASRDLEDARAAYNSAEGEDDLKAIEMSKQAHDSTHGAEQHRKGGDYVKSIIYGGLDGIITTFAVVAAVAGSGMEVSVVIVMGFANLFADGLSMGFGDFLSSQAEDAFARNEMKREAWEVKNHLEGEKKEMIELYESKGLSKEDSTAIVDIISKDPKIFVDIMMVEELGIMPPDDDTSGAWKNGAVTFCSFCIFGCVPLLAYVIVAAAIGKEESGKNKDALFGASIGLTVVALAGLGAVKGGLTGEPKWKAALLTMVNGSAAAAVSYIVGFALEEAMGGESGCASTLAPTLSM